MFSERSDGHWRIFKEPEKGKVYSIGCDVAEGDEGGDHSAVFIIDKEMNQVASYYGHIAPDLLGIECCEAGKHYNTAIIVPEVNNHGLTTTYKIRDLKYPNVYSRETKEERADKITRKLGWQTNVKTKSLMLDNFCAMYRDRELKICDLELLKEMLTLAIEDDGKIILNGKDRIVAACLALQGLSQASLGEFKAFAPTQEKKFKSFMDRARHSVQKTESYFD